MMHKRFILLLGVVLGSYVPAAAQTPAPLILQAQERLSPIMPMLRTVPVRLPAASFLLPQGPGKSPAHFGRLFAGAYEGDHSLKSLLAMEEVKTLFVTQSSLPIAPLWGGRLQLDAFESTLNMQNVQLGPSGSGGLRDFRPRRGGYPNIPRSVGLYGISLRFRFGRHVQTGRSTHVWRCLAWIVGPGHGCRL